MGEETAAHALVLTLSCKDQTGIVAAVSGLLAQEGCFISRSRSYGDRDTERFFMRLAFHPTREGFDRERFRSLFAEVAERFAMTWRLAPASHRTKTVILLSRSDHCATSLLQAARSGEVPIQPVGLASNHADLAEPLAHWGVPFTLAPVDPMDKAAAEAKLFDLIDATGAELVVLARYMQILSEDACKRLSGRCINIHHSFLPSFKGARPYHQAHARGVKMIGATAHYVTEDLDEGPIIEQRVEPVDHSFTTDELVQTGRHLEARALVAAVKAHAERRVFLNGAKTVVFS